jgi:hypothetical protein
MTVRLKKFFSYQLYVALITHFGEVIWEIDSLNVKQQSKHTIYGVPCVLDPDAAFEQVPEVSLKHYQDFG